MALLSSPQIRGLYFYAMVKALRQAGAKRGLDDAIRIIKGDY